MPGEKAPEHERREQILSAALRVAEAEGLAAVTSRRVAAEAGLSVGLIAFHFGTMDGLILALLDWWLERLSAPLTRFRPGATDRRRDTLVELLSAQVGSVARDRTSAALFFDFWALGTRRPEIRARIRAELGRYRDNFRRILAESLPEVTDDGTLSALAALAVAVVYGYAVQATFDLEGVPEAPYMDVVAEVLTRALRPEEGLAGSSAAAARR